MCDECTFDARTYKRINSPPIEKKSECFASDIRLRSFVSIIQDYDIRAADKRKKSLVDNECSCRLGIESQHGERCKNAIFRAKPNSRKNNAHS